ncbi:hypothetical protein NBRC116188_27210 [Oceaniserpentilla sp. 4NH20-0058]|uniref:hypothetical protein n=1 Tax=Oceaniserpentilla sp. 4NH20-0058 TaxID=3127660 RepID=UPI00310830EA
MKKLLFIVGLGITLSGCTALMKDSVTNRATFDLDCSQYKLNVTQLGDRVFGVKGCNKKATYVVDGPCQGVGSKCTAIMNSDLDSE